MRSLEKLSKWIRTTSGFLGINIAYILKGGSFLTLGNIVSAAVNFVLAFFFARLLPKEIYGTYGYILAWVSVFGIFALPGMDNAVIQSVSRGFESSFISGWKSKVKYGFMGTVASLLIGAYYNNGNQTLSLAFFAAAIFIPFLNGFQIYNAYLLGKKEFKTSAYYTISGQLFIALTLITALYLTNNIVYLISAYLIANFIPNFVFFTRTKLKARLSVSEEDAGLTNYAKHLSLINVVSIIASYLDQFLAFHFLGPANLANYAFATAPPEQIKGLFKGLPDLALPKFSERSEEELKKTMWRKILILSVFTILIVAAYIILAPWFYKIFFPRYVDAVFLSQIFALSLLNTPPSLIIGALTAHKKIKKLYLFNIISPLFQIIIMAVLASLYGLIGLIIARIVARTFNTLLSLGIYYKS